LNSLVPKTRPDNPLVSIVVPVLNEEGCVAELARRVAAALEATNTRYELLFVDDGSRDNTAAAIAEVRKSDPTVKTIRFTRSFGHQAALAAGFQHASGDAVVTMDGDLQHPPEFIPTLVSAWLEGIDVVNTIRQSTPNTRFGSKELLGGAFYRVMSALTPVSIKPAAADFRLLDRRVVDAFNGLEERFIFVRGLIPWLGFEEVYFDYDVGERFAGRSKYPFWSMFRLALDGIFSFSVVPLRLISLLGFGTTLFGIAFGTFSIISHLAGNVDGTGWTTLVVLILIFGGIQMLSIGIVSEYIGRTYEEVKRRPRYVIDSTAGLDQR
jgi:glycosyltransferase involved in cell wall biosynthesis